ncbi:MAG: hypothetical protein WAQ05_24315 [Rubrivivax sp.]
MRWISEERYRRWLHRGLSWLGRKVVVINIDYMGLGNRLKLLAIYDASFGLDNTTLFWNREGWVNCTMADIVSIDGVTGFREVPITEKRWMVPVITHPSKPYWWPRGYWRFDVDAELPDSYLIERRGRIFPAVDFLYAATPQPYLDRYLAFFARVRPSAEVAARIAEVPVQADDVCVQVRITVDPKDRANVPRIESYLRRMQEFPAHTRFFISTLDGSVSAAFRAAFGNRILELPGKRYRSMVDATADMYLLSKGGTYIVSQGSTFGEVSWWLGGGRQRVIEMPIEVQG